MLDEWGTGTHFQFHFAKSHSVNITFLFAIQSTLHQNVWFFFLQAAMSELQQQGY